MATAARGWCARADLTRQRHGRNSIVLARRPLAGLHEQRHRCIRSRAAAVSGHGHQTQVSVGGGTAPQWSADGGTIYYRRGAELLKVTISSTDPVEFGKPTIALNRPDAFGYQLLPDGSFIAVQNRQDVGTVTELNLVVNWFEELKRLAPAR